MVAVGGVVMPPHVHVCYINALSYHMIMYTHSCGLWDSSVYYQWISWETNNHNIHRESDLQL